MVVLLYKIYDNVSYTMNTFIETFVSFLEHEINMYCRLISDIKYWKKNDDMRDIPIDVENDELITQEGYKGFLIDKRGYSYIDSMVDCYENVEAMNHTMIEYSKYILRLKEYRHDLDGKTPLFTMYIC